VYKSQNVVPVVHLESGDATGNGLLFHMTLLISRSNTKSQCTLGKPPVSEH